VNDSTIPSTEVAIHTLPTSSSLAVGPAFPETATDTSQFKMVQAPFAICSTAALDMTGPSETSNMLCLISVEYGIIPPLKTSLEPG
tara:strand:- start:65 stop:322 length:258 start_codon:yes stop_codon:yes gene_type:complete